MHAPVSFDFVLVKFSYFALRKVLMHVCSTVHFETQCFSERYLGI